MIYLNKAYLVILICILINDIVNIKPLNFVLHLVNISNSLACYL